MNSDFSSVTRVDQFLDVLDRALHKIGKNLSAEMISDAYAGIESNDKLFVEIAANKLIEEYEVDAREAIVAQCEKNGVFDYLRKLDAEDVNLEERKELREQYCGAVIDVNSLLSEQRMRMKKRIILALEKEILALDEELHTMYNRNRDAMKQIAKG
ncbi:hypothetical protein WA577_004156, partial [Blastocystis sp. JDR]